MAGTCVALCEGCGASTKLLEMDAPTWDLRPSDLLEFLQHHRQCAARLGDRPCITLEIVNR